MLGGQSIVRAMFLVVNGDGRYWDGLGWNVKGKIFCSLGSATRSLYEEGEGIEGARILPLEPQDTHQMKEQ